jgi:hypothetical protein
MPLSRLVVASPCCLHYGVDICAFTAMVNKTFNKSIPYKDFELMNEATVCDVKPKNQANNKWSRGNSEDSKSDDSYDDDKQASSSKQETIIRF